MQNDDHKIEIAIAKYQTAINKNISESEVLWNRYNTLLVFNSILIATIGLSYQNNIHLPTLISISLPIVGLITCFIWTFTTFKGFRWIYKWIVYARDIENKYIKDDNDKYNPIIRGNINRSANNIKIGANEIGITEICCYILIVLTTAMYSLFLLNIFTNYPHFQKINRNTQYNNRIINGYNLFMK